MFDLRTIVAVAVGAAVGGVLRYVIAVLFAQRFGVAFPYGTLFINITGSFLIGLVIELSQTRAFGITPFARIALTVGLIGGYTTFSAYAFETFTLASEGERTLAAAYAAGSVVLGLAAYYAGMVCARLIAR